MSRNVLFFVGAVVLAGVGVLVLRTPAEKLRPALPASAAPTEELTSATDPGPADKVPGRMAVNAPDAAPAPMVPSEDVLMDRLRASLGQSSPEVILGLARDADKRYPDGPQAEERSLYIIDALIALDRLTEMRDEARRHLLRWPNTKISERVMARTGVHPEPRPLQ